MSRRTVPALLLLWPALAWAEGSDDTNTVGFDPQWLDARVNETTSGQPGGNLYTTVFVDILAAGEVITFQHAGTAQLFTPTGTAVGSFSNGQSHTTTATGAYRVEYDRDQVDWDIAVDDTAAGMGRVWSRAWHFDAKQYDVTTSAFASFYALVEGGDPSHDGVVEMRTDGLAGYLYLIAANRFGMTNANGRSVPQGASFPSVPIEYRIYLNPPEIGKYNPLTPTISDVAFEYDSAICQQVAEGVATGAFSITSDVEGTYHIVCDLNDDGTFDISSGDDLHLIGETSAQTREIAWDGTDNDGDPVPAGEYDCEAFLTVGEFHYVAGDVESSYPGFRLFEVNKSGASITRASTDMYWNDELVQQFETYLPSTTTQGLVRSGPDGIASGTYPTSCTPGVPGANPCTTPNVNARSWGNFDTNPTAINDDRCGVSQTAPCSKGDVAWLDTYTWLRESNRVAFTVTVGSIEDGDSDNLLDAEEECLYGTDPGDADTDDDNLDDDVEVLLSLTDPTDADTDGDGIQDDVEVGGNPSAPVDSDNDGLDDALDPDDDNDGIPTSVEHGFADADTDGKPNHLDLDSDGDGIPDSTEGNVHSDGDSLPDFLDPDSDNDSLLDSAEGTTDSDGDGLGDFRDPDDDDDTIPTIDEIGEGNTDGDDFPDYLDDDDDNDGIPTAVEVSFADGDTDTVPNHQDLDSDADGIPDATEGNVHSDDDALPNFLDLDSDGDTLLDSVEGTTDSDGDTLADFRDPDDDGDTIPTAVEAPRGNTDGDDIASDHLDPDDDNDGIDTAVEAADGADYGEGGNDVDGDGDDNWYDTDADDDGVLDEDEGRDDTDRDGTLNYLDPDGAYVVDYAGSCLLSTGGPAPTGALAGLLALGAAAFVRRRRAGVVAALLALFAVAPAHAAGDGPEISKSVGRPGQVVVLWPRVVPSAASDEILLVAGTLQEKLAEVVEAGAPDLVRNVRPEPERVCPKSTGCKAPSVGVLLAHTEGGCVVVGWVSEKGKSPAQLVPLAGRLDLKAQEAPFREPPESQVTVRDFVACDTVAEHLDPAGLSRIQALLREAK